MKNTTTIRRLLLILATLALFGAIYFFIKPPLTYIEIHTSSCLVCADTITKVVSEVNYLPAGALIAASTILYAVWSGLSLKRRNIVLTLAALSLFAAVFFFVFAPTAVEELADTKCGIACDGMASTFKTVPNYTPAYVALTASAVLFVGIAAAHSAKADPKKTDTRLKK